jgi:antitoxin CptB
MHDPHLAKLRWRCHRGMLELDLFLLGFFDQCFAQLLPPEQACFEDLLAETDPELYTWLLGSEEPAPQYQSLIQQIRSFHAERGS